MAKKRSGQRPSSAPGVKKLPAAAFAGPNRSYPTNTPGRAVAAKGRATQAVKAGRMSPAMAARIDAQANRKLGKGRGGRRGA
ncbi:MAG TPA: hypothetical protein VN903_28590 [Polyangia bacterium]|nr:hypothetical protein [Polyangia bacterium]